MAASVIGRERELAAIEAVLGRAPGTGSNLVFHGEPGIGKSVLLRTAVASAQAAGMRILGGAGYESEAQLTFAGLHQLFAPALGYLDDPGVALAEMAKALGKNTDADRWRTQADRIRKLILEKLFVEDDAAFYDLDANDRFIRIRSDILSRVCGEHVVDQKQFEILWERQIHNPRAFWAIYPLPSIALDDPAFVRPIPRNSWGGASQALTALRAPRWFEFYRKPSALSFLMDRWCDAILRDATFRQQLDPLTGIFTQGDAPNYSPAALVMVDFTWRLAGVREEAGAIEWNVRPAHAELEAAIFLVRVSLHGDGRKDAAL